MPDSDKVLAILIQLGVVGQQDVKTATDLLQENVTATVAGGKATEELGAKTEDATQSFKLFNTHSEEFNQLVSELNRVTPGLGLALKAAFDPENIGIAAIISATGTLVGQIMKLREAAQKPIRDNAGNLNAGDGISAAGSSDIPSPGMLAKTDSSRQMTSAPAAQMDQSPVYEELMDRTQKHISDLAGGDGSNSFTGAQAKELANSIDALARSASENAERKVQAFIDQVNQMLNAHISTNGL